MKTRGLLIIPFIFVVFLLMPAQIQAQRSFQFEFLGGPLEILTESDFESQFGHNPRVPKTDEAIIALARSLYPPLGQERVLPREPGHMCSTPENTLLFDALRNPAISDVTRQTVDAEIQAAKPALNRERDFGHFRIRWTDNNADYRHNVTVTQVQRVAMALNACWKLYSRSFQMPKHTMIDGKRMIEVNIYYGGKTVGLTLPIVNWIFLNSELCVKDDIQCRTAPAHELFHRVQFAYGFEEAADWVMEGSASWSEKLTCKDLGEYLDTMGLGLKKPNMSLLDRSYNAIHFWVYLEERAGKAAIRDFFTNYSANGKRIGPALSKVIRARFSTSLSRFVFEWGKANFMKDLDNISPTYDYDEDETVVSIYGKTFGPLPHIKPVKRNVFRNSSYTIQEMVDRLAARYYEFNLQPTLTNLKIKIDGSPTGALHYYFLGIKNDQKVMGKYYPGPEVAFERTLTAGQWDRLVLVVGGRTQKGGEYTIKIGNTDKCMTGTWHDSRGAVWTLEQYGGSITGKIQTPNLVCGVYRLVGNLVNDTDIFMQATNDPPVDGCAQTVTFEGTVTGCTSAGGTYYNSNGNSGEWSMSKQSSSAASHLTDPPMTTWWDPEM